jgi:uncharacterized protein
MTDERSYPAGVPCWVDTDQPDVDAARDFYAGVFGWTFSDAVPTEAPGTYLIAALGGAGHAPCQSLSHRRGVYGVDLGPRHPLQIRRQTDAGLRPVAGRAQCEDRARPARRDQRLDRAGKARRDRCGVGATIRMVAFVELT